MLPFWRLLLKGNQQEATVFRGFPYFEKSPNGSGVLNSTPIEVISHPDPALSVFAWFRSHLVLPRSSKARSVAIGKCWVAPPCRIPSF